jgi:deferrochelatase/peroxidase EfeB
VFGAFDLTSDRPADLRDLLRAWTDAARRMTAGEATGAAEGPSEVPPAPASLGEYIRHTGGGLFAILPGVRRGVYLGQGLLG